MTKQLFKAVDADARVDTREMSATAVISTDTVDREGDLLEPNGIQLDNYKRNPVVMWDHGLGDIQTPIAKSEDPAGNLTVEIGDGQVIATSYFSNRSLASEQIFSLIEDRIVRAASVRAEPVKSSMIRGDDGEAGLYLEEWDLIEWSWTPIGVNPDALEDTLAHNRLAGRQIGRSLKKSLTGALRRKRRAANAPLQRQLLRTRKTICRVAYKVWAAKQLRRDIAKLQIELYGEATPADDAEQILELDRQWREASKQLRALERQARV